MTFRPRLYIGIKRKSAVVQNSFFHGKFYFGAFGGFNMVTLLCGTLLVHCVNCADTPPGSNIPRNDAEGLESPAAEWDENSQSIVHTYWEHVAAAIGLEPHQHTEANSSAYRIDAIEKQLAEVDKPGERYNFRPIANIFFELYDFINSLTKNHPFGYTMYEEAQKREFITSQFTERKFDGRGQFSLKQWIDPSGHDVYSILMANYPVNRPFNVQVYEAIPIDEYKWAHYYAEENRGKINIHSFLYLFTGRLLFTLISDSLREELFPTIEQNCTGERKFNLCIIQHVMCFGVQLHYNLHLLKAYKLKIDLGMLKTTNADLLSCDPRKHNPRRITYESELDFYVDSIRSKFYVQWMHETAETITRQKDIKLIPNQISTSGSLKAQIKRKMASICKKYEDIVVNMVQKVKGRKQRREE